jgi:flagellar M-ring protein FliF
MDLLAGLKQTVARLGLAKIATLAVVAIATLSLLLWVSSLSVEPMGLLYAELDPAESAKIGQKLEELKVPFEVKGDGTTIMVPASQVAHARMELAGAGLPHQNGAGYELLDQQSPMNMTSFMQRIQRLRALEGELARTIVTLNGVRTARVHIVLPERETFARETPKPTASVAVTMAGAGRLGAPQAAAIRQLVSGAVPGMAAESVSVLDPSGVVLAADDSEGAQSGRLNEQKSARERELQRAVSELLEPLVGHDKVRVAAAVELETSREVSHEEKFDPLSQVERSKQSQVDQDLTSDNKGQEPVSVSQNLPNPTASTSGDAGKSTTNNARNGSTINYEISSIKSERVREAGDLKRMTIAVVVDGTIDSKGVYQPRSQDELSRLSELIQSAVGFDVNRGDRVTVETMHFAAEPQTGTGAETIPATIMQPQLIWIAVGGAVIVLIAIGAFVVTRARKNKPLALALGPSNEQDQTGLAMFQGVPALPPGETPVAALSGPQSEKRLGIGQAVAQGKLSGPPLQEASVSPESPALPFTPAGPLAARPALLSALFDLVDTRPDEALATLRSWLAASA